MKLEINFVYLLKNKTSRGKKKSKIPQNWIYLTKIPIQFILLFSLLHVHTNNIV